MQKNILNRWIVVGLSLLLAIILLINDIQHYTSGDSKKSIPNFLFDSNIINLGLDLQGGAEFFLSADLEKWILQEVGNPDDSSISNEVKFVSDEAKKDLTEAIELYRKDKKAESLSFDLLEDYLKKTTHQSTISDLFPGKTKSDKENELKDALNANKDIIQKRIDEKGVVEPSVRIASNSISVEIPGEHNITKLKKLITTSAKLEFSEVKYFPGHKDIYNLIETFIDLDTLISKIQFPEGQGELIYLKKEHIEEFKDRVSLKIDHDDFSNQKIAYFKPTQTFSNEILTELVEIKKEDALIGVLYKSKPNITGENITNAIAQNNGRTGAALAYEILLEFDDDTNQEWSDYTRDNIGKRVAITLDNEVLTAPGIEDHIEGGSASRITGGFDYGTAKDIEIALNNGKFNLPLKVDAEYQTGPELGEKMISLGSFAFIIGIACVIVFMIIYYKLAGIIASIALIINMILMSAILSFLGATLTLPGIAGFILTVGIAVDANVIIFERIKEELIKGTPPLSAIESGYDRAFITILDANVTTLLTALILYFIGTGPIKGFAITLSAGILCSMFTAIYITRTIYGSLYYSKFPKKLNI